MSQHFDHLAKGLDVYDKHNDKIGTIGEVYPDVSAAGDGCLKVDAGFLSLGKYLFIPLASITDVVDDHVVLNVKKDAIDTMGWDQEPSYVPDSRSMEKIEELNDA